MRVQFLGKSNKVLYCDDEIVRITREKTLFKKGEMKEKKVHDFSKVEISAGPCIKFYDHAEQLWDEVYFDKEYLPRTERIAEKIRVESRKYLDSFKDEDFHNNEKLIPLINKLLETNVKNESEFIDTIYTLQPEVFRLSSHPVKIFFKKDEAWDYMSFSKVSQFAETLYNIIYEIFIESGYIFKDGEDIELQCHKHGGEELISFSSQTKEIIKKMIEEGEISG